jgi:effector-binding domain-containing protein
MNHLNSLHELPGGAPIVCFHNMDLEHLDVEIGFPVATLLTSKEDITVNTIPSQKVVTAIDLGPYEKQDQTLEEIFVWIERNGCKMNGEIYYQYLNDTERPENELLTMMIVPVA